MGAKNTHIVRDSEAAAYWNEGKLEIIEGPAVIYPAKDSVVEPIQFFSANERQYLKVEFSDGHTEHIPGPVRMMQHPTEHRSIDVCRANEVSADEVIVVMTKAHKKAGDGRMERQVIRGPCMHIPAVGEVQQEFSWHGSDPNNPGRKCPNALRFTKLRVIPDQMYLSVPEVRTSDDALVVINLMIFYELRDVETMLNRTHDPIADFMNAATADVILFAATLSYELFLEKTDLLNKLESYPQLVTRAKSIGFDVTKVVYRGYTAPPRLQSMHDDAIQARTQLRLEAETEEQAQRLADMKLTKEFQRQKQSKKYIYI